MIIFPTPCFCKELFHTRTILSSFPQWWNIMNVSHYVAVVHWANKLTDLMSMLLHYGLVLDSALFLVAMSRGSGNVPGCHCANAGILEFWLKYFRKGEKECYMKMMTNGSLVNAIPQGFGRGLVIEPYLGIICTQVCFLTRGCTTFFHWHSFKENFEGET